MSDHGFHPDHLRPRTIPMIPAGPAIEHRDFGILALSGPGIRRDELLHGAGVLDIAPTVLALYGLPAGADMDGKVLAAAFEEPPAAGTIPSWDEVPGEDGCHPPHTRLDPVAARESLDQLVALGYIQAPGEDRRQAVADTIQELRYNLGEAYEDADRHGEAYEIFRDLYRADPDEQRFAVHLFVSCQALGLQLEMREIVDDLDGRRRKLFEQARTHLRELRTLVRARAKERNEAKSDTAPAGGTKPNRRPLLTPEERAKALHWQQLARFQPPVIDYLKAQILTAERRWGEALTALGRVTEAHLARPALFLQTAELYARLRQWDEAERVYAKALEIDPDNPYAHVGMCRMALRRRDHAAAAQSALNGIQRLYHYPVAHFLLGVALAGLGRYERAAEAFRVALSLNPNFPQAHLRLSMLLRRRLNDPAAADEHLRLFREVRRGVRAGAAEPAAPPEPHPAPAAAPGFPLPPLTEEVVVVSGLPRSGTSMIMQMLAAGGVPILTDGLRQPDEENPRGYLEYEPVKQLQSDARWLECARGKAVKVVAPLVPALPAGVSCRLILIERNLDEVLDSQAKMLARKRESLEDTPGRRSCLKEEYTRLVQCVKAMARTRPGMEILTLGSEAVLHHPDAAAEAIDRFLGGGLAVESMAAQVKPELHRQRGVARSRRSAEALPTGLP